MVNLSVTIGKLRLKNPVMVASGTFGAEYGELTDMNKLGAIVTKTITLKPRLGNNPPRLVETASGMLNSIGLENKGLEDFMKNKIPLFSKVRSTLVASIAGENEQEIKKLAKALSSVERIGGLELNLSCPNVKHGNQRGLLAHDPKATYKVVKAARSVTALTIIAKLSPNVTDITEIAKAAEAAGADAVSLTNTYMGMAVDINTRRPRLGNVIGGLSGPAIKPLSLRMVYEARKSLAIPIIGIGGIMDFRDAIEFIICGATAIQVGTANFVNPAAAEEIADGIKKYLVMHKIADVNQLVGRLSY